MVTGFPQRGEVKSRVPQLAQKFLGTRHISRYEQSVTMTFDVQGMTRTVQFALSSQSSLSEQSPLCVCPCRIDFHSVVDGRECSEEQQKLGQQLIEACRIVFQQV